MTGPNQKTKTITQSIVSHVAFDLRTSIGRFPLQSRACSIYSRVTQAEQELSEKKSCLRETHQTIGLFKKSPFITRMREIHLHKCPLSAGQKQAPTVNITKGGYLRDLQG